MAKDRSLNARSRADFLFNHELSRYSAKDVDKISEEQPCAIRIVVIGGLQRKVLARPRKMQHGTHYSRKSYEVN